jgi:hypothetical protein
LQQALEAGTPLPAILPTPFMAKILLRRADTAPSRTKDQVLNDLAGQGGRHWISAMNAYLCFLSAVDDVVMVIKRAVGEQNVVDLTIFESAESKV